jgi:hypothetical protein
LYFYKGNIEKAKSLFETCSGVQVNKWQLCNGKHVKKWWYDLCQSIY